jgi:hypothetical protein
MDRVFLRLCTKLTRKRFLVLKGRRSATQLSFRSCRIVELSCSGKLKFSFSRRRDASRQRGGARAFRFANGKVAPMKPISAFFLSLAAGLSTFAAQNYFLPPQLHAAPLLIPSGPDWRQQMLAEDPGAPGLNHLVAHLTEQLELDGAQASKARQILQQHDERIMALLLTGPASMTREQFLAQERRITKQSRGQLDALLTPDQLEILRELRPPGRA